MSNLRVLNPYFRNLKPLGSKLSCRFQLQSPCPGPPRKILEKSPSSKAALGFDPLPGP
ncbi:unnamed protein product [Brassica rapa subsp. trilocularis]